MTRANHNKNVPPHVSMANDIVSLYFRVSLVEKVRLPATSARIHFCGLGFFYLPLLCFESPPVICPFPPHVV